MAANIPHLVRPVLGALLLLTCPGTLLSAPAEARATRPNVILILADDLGWSDVGCFGGEIRTPQLDRLAANGVRFTRFFNSGKCEPTRASLMSGQYWQDAGLGVKHGITMGQAMRSAGYATFAVGKWHLDGNPVERGFDHYFGHLSGASDYFKGNPSHRLDLEAFVPKDDTFYTTDANAEYATRFITESRRQHPEKPFFLYLAFNAPHGPLQAWPEDIAKYRGTYRAGWDKVRERRYARLVELGLIPRTSALSPRPETIPPWESLSAQEQHFEDLRMSIYAAMVDRMDQAIGRVLQTVRDLGQEDNTLVLFLSDNGGNPYDRQRTGILPDRGARWEYGAAWANVSNTPFRHYKRNMYNGGACAPLIAYWPAGLKGRGTITDQPAHIIDLMATLIDVSGAAWPATYEGKPLRPLPGLSLRPIFAGETRSPHEALYFQLFDHRAVMVGDYKLASDWGRPWELFNLAADRTELHDLSNAEPERRAALEKLWNAWWADKPQQLLRAAGAEPVYRRLGDATEASQGGNDEPSQMGPARAKRRGRKAADTSTR